MENNNVNKKINILTALVVVLIALVIILGGSFAYMYFGDNTGNDVPMWGNGQNSGESIKDLSLDDPVVKELSDKVIGAYANNYASSYEDYFYKRDKIVLANEDISFKLSLTAESLFDSFKTYDEGYDCDTGVCGISYIDEATLKNAYYKLFGNDSEYSRATFTVGGCSGEYKWSNENNRYESLIEGGCGGATCGGVDGELAFAKQITSTNENKIEIYERLYYLDCATDGEYYYYDYNKTKLIGAMDSILPSNINSYDDEREYIFNNYADKLDMYKYTFVKDSNDNYAFTSVEKVK